MSSKNATKVNVGYTILMIRKVWQAVFGEDVVDVGNRSAYNQYRVSCPFHTDSRPSCDVDVDKEVFFCRACPAHGGCLDVVVLAGNANTRREAVNWLQRRGIVVTF